MFRAVPARLVALCLCLAALSCSEGPAKPTIGETAPDFTLSALDGSRHRLSDLRGKVVFVNLWATWCPPCRHEMPSMIRLYDMLREEGLEILAVSEDTDEDALRRFVQSYGVNFPVLRDENKKVYNLYMATGVPETHLIDKRGKLVSSLIGPFDWTSPEVVARVRELLRQ
jgi:peroxiredoxin